MRSVCVVSSIKDIIVPAKRNWPQVVYISKIECVACRRATALATNFATDGKGSIKSN
jgi:hypothetical protein